MTVKVARVNISLVLRVDSNPIKANVSIYYFTREFQWFDSHTLFFTPRDLEGKKLTSSLEYTIINISEIPKEYIFLRILVRKFFLLKIAII